ncbi:hypothetical protein KO528_13165 [Saccharophagus degradans]|uniref:hypothetical protein n=1 Tax=Saccharophagus degradans TaxID=86304 RepID=UPI001C0A4D21|nr:hypothetical protein [Saccharophagus degradans]MBU2986304.1 hypothetical protein [Saccharophagus degradans]
MYRFVLSSIFFVWISTVNAAPDPVLSQTLQQKQQELAALTKKVDAAAAVLADEQANLARHAEGLEEATQSLVDAEREMKAKLLAAETNPDETAMRESVLASIRYNRFEARVKRYTGRKEESEQSVAAAEQVYQNLAKQQKDLEFVISELSSKRDELASKKVAASTNVQAAQSVSAPAKAAEVVTPVAAKTEVPKAKVSIEDAAGVGTWPYLSNASEQDIRYARTYIAELEADKAKGEIDSAPLAEVELVAKNSFGKSDMDYLGDDLYMLTKKVRAGSQRFALFNKDYWHTIPEADDQAEYVFIFDVSSLSKPELFLFKKSLIAQ